MLHKGYNYKILIMKSRTIIIDYNFLTTAHLRKLFNKNAVDFHKFVKNLYFNFELKIYSRRGKDKVIQYLEENDLIDNISEITSKKEPCLLFLDSGSMYSIDDLVLAYYDKSPELESCMLADRI